MERDALICIEGTNLGLHPEAHGLNASFRRDVPILKLSVEINWEPRESLAAVAGLEARLLKLCPSLRKHQCRGQEEYHVLRSLDGNGRQRQLPETGITIEAALALAHLYEHVLIDTMAFITDSPVVSGATGALNGTTNRFDIFVESPDAVVARLTVGLATGWIHTLVTGGSPDGEGRMTLELARYLYRFQPKAVHVNDVARGLGRTRERVREGLDWLERQGLARRISYAMNFSGSSYYGMPVANQEPWIDGPLNPTTEPERSRTA
jgi:hypothetical protein